MLTFFYDSLPHIKWQLTINLITLMLYFRYCCHCVATNCTTLFILAFAISLVCICVCSCICLCVWYAIHWPLHLIWSNCPIMRAVAMPPYFSLLHIVAFVFRYVALYKYILLFMCASKQQIVTVIISFAGNCVAMLTSLFIWKHLFVNKAKTSDRRNKYISK